MIIDAHFHIFPPFGTESGGEDPEIESAILSVPHATARKSIPAQVGRRLGRGATISVPFR